jgi:hypothetical protein
LAILHHTDCGIRRLASYPEQLAAFFEIPVADLGSKAVEDPYASVRIDVDIARHRLPPDLLVSGLVYDVDTGRIEVVVPAACKRLTTSHGHGQGHHPPDECPAKKKLITISTLAASSLPKKAPSDVRRVLAMS